MWTKHSIYQRQTTYDAKNAMKSTLGLFARDRHIDVLATWTCWKSLASRSEDMSTAIVTKVFHVAKKDESGDIPGKGPCGIWGNIYVPVFPLIFHPLSEWPIMAENPCSPGDMFNDFLFSIFNLTFYGDCRVWGLFFAATLAMACCRMHVVTWNEGSGASVYRIGMIKRFFSGFTWCIRAKVR